MADKVEKIKVNAVERAVRRDVKQESRLEPTNEQERVKARFHRRVQEMSHMYDLEQIFRSKELTLEMAGTSKILKWLENPAFARWFMDEHYISDTISSLQSKSVQALNSILTSNHTRDSDKIKVARLLLELGDQFPGRKSEVRFLDDRINNMTESETDKEIKRLREVMRTVTDGKEAE